jgi:hypothetical protein
MLFRNLTGQEVKNFTTRDEIVIYEPSATRYFFAHERII